MEARLVQVEVDACHGLPQVHIVGLPDAAVRESRERVRAAIRNCGFHLEPRAVVISLAPADLRKEGNHLDLAIALALLASHGHIPQAALAGRLFCGELGLDGAIRPVRGGLAIADLCANLGVREVLVPAATAAEASVLAAVRVIAVRSLSEAVGHVLGSAPLPAESPGFHGGNGSSWTAGVVADGGADASGGAGGSGAGGSGGRHGSGGGRGGNGRNGGIGGNGAGRGERGGGGGGGGGDMGAALAFTPDLAAVRGQDTAKRALEIAAAGGHNLLFLGPPGSGKTMLARCLPGLLPPLSESEAIAVTKIHSVAAEQPPAGLLRQRPFRSPHASTSTAGMIGGGSPPRPGEASLAHLGVLFLDELPEFRRDTLEALRQPLEEGSVSVVRARARMRFPARFALLAAMNPCPCGHLGDPRIACRCPSPVIERYRGRISGPLLDRIDLHVEVLPPTLRELRGAAGEGSAPVAERIRAARERQLARLGPTSPSPVNASLAAAELRRHCRPDAAGQHLLDEAFQKLGLSVRALDRVLKVARTLADLEGADQIRPVHIAEAIQYRALDRRFLN